MFIGGKEIVISKKIVIVIDKDLFYPVSLNAFLKWFHQHCILYSRFHYRSYFIDVRNAERFSRAMELVDLAIQIIISDTVLSILIPQIWNWHKLFFGHFFTKIQIKLVNFICLKGLKDLIRFWAKVISKQLNYVHAKIIS